MASSSRYLFGPLSGFGVVVVAIVCVADQASKFWLLNVFGLADRGVVKFAPFVDLVLAWNTGISFSWFQQEGQFGQGALLAFKALAVALLWIWLARSSSRLSALSLGLIIGGAIGNAVDRVIHGAVLDFVLLYLQTATWRFNWYVFNLADVAIVAGVIGLLYESLWGETAPKAP